MITKKEAAEKVKKYEEQIERQAIEATEKVKQATIAWCNEDLSKEIAKAADDGGKAIIVNTVEYNSYTRECVSTVKKDFNGSYPYYNTIREIHPVTFVNFVKEHGFEIEEERTSYDVSPTKTTSNRDGIKYTIKWA